jgi:hypothetical protein
METTLKREYMAGLSGLLGRSGEPFEI